MLPFVVLCALVAVELAIAGYGVWASATAARAGARAGYVGGDSDAAARSALPPTMRREAEVTGGAGETAVAVPVPGVLPGDDRVNARARVALDPTGGDG